MAELLSVLVGGLMAVGGGGATQWYLNKIKLENEEKRQRAIKFEELVSGIYEFDHWLTTYRNINVYGSNDTETVTPFAKMQAITLIYFPEYSEKIQELETTSNKYILWMFAAGLRRLAGDIDSLNEGHTDASSLYVKARLELLDDLGEFSKRVFK